MRYRQFVALPSSNAAFCREPVRSPPGTNGKSRNHGACGRPPHRPTCRNACCFWSYGSLGIRSPAHAGAGPVDTAVRPLPLNRTCSGPPACAWTASHATGDKGRNRRLACPETGSMHLTVCYAESDAAVRSVATRSPCRNARSMWHVAAISVRRRSFHQRSLPPAKSSVSSAIAHDTAPPQRRTAFSLLGHSCSDQGKPIARFSSNVFQSVRAHTEASLPCCPKGGNTIAVGEPAPDARRPLHHDKPSHRPAVAQTVAFAR